MLLSKIQLIVTFVENTGLKLDITFLVLKNVYRYLKRLILRFLFILYL